MSTQIKLQEHILVTMTMSICLVVLGACGRASPSTPTFLPTLQSSPSARDLPDFLRWVYPPPDILVLQRDISTTSVSWAVLELGEIAEPGEVLTPEEMQNRVEFLIDGELRNIEATSFLNRPTQAAIIGEFALSVGEHEATVRVRRASGEVLEYSWTFTVWAEEPTAPGLPEWLQFVRPLPNSTVTVQEYREANLVPAHLGFGDFRGGICMGVQTCRIVELGEYLDCSGVLRKFSFVTLDGAPLHSVDATIEGGCELVLNETTDEEGRVVRSYPGPRAYQCLIIDLTPGEHEVTVQLQMASGEVVEYTWRFTITDD